MPRWITVRKPFDYSWPGRTAITAFGDAHLGEHMVKDEVADFAVGNGYATEGKVDGSARSKKGGAKRVATRRRKKDQASVSTANSRTGPPVGDADVSAHDRAADRAAVDNAAG
jgi:hypothetical protein